MLTPYVFATEQPRRLTPEERETLAPYLEDGEPARVDPPRPSGGAREKLGHYPVHVRFSDVDVYGHVNNVKYFEYFMEARILLTARLWRDVPTGDAEPVTWWSRRPTSTTGSRSSSAPSRTTPGPGSPASVRRR